MQKKAQGLSLNVIIVAAIALLVLVILSVVFMTRMRGYNASVQDCKHNGGECVPAYQCDTSTGQYTVLSHIQCPQQDQNYVCCVKLT